MVSEWVLNERMSEMEQIVWSDLLIIIVTFIAIGWFFWSVSIRNKKKGDDEWEITPQSSSPITNQIKKGCISCEDGFLTTLKQLSLPENGTFWLTVIPHQTKKVKNHHHYMIRHSHLLSLVVESLGQIN